MKTRREFLRDAMTLAAAAGASAPIPAGPAPGDERRENSDSVRGKRVFAAGFSHETNTFHPIKTETFSFSTAEGFSLEAWKDAGLVVVPGVSAYPNGGGTVDGAACREAMDRVLGSLRAAMPVEAVFLRLHGAMYAEGIGPAESVLVGEARSIVGPNVPISCTFDLHGNIPARLGRHGDILVGLKTAPHTDGARITELAGRILLETLRGKARPVSYVLPIPMILPGEKAMTTAEPFGSLVEEARRLEREGVPGHSARILAATLFVGCAWTDSPDTGMSVMVTADGSREAARAAAVHLARRIWDARERFAFGCETAELEEGVTRALEAAESTVFLSDGGDDTTASTPGDLPIVLRHLVERNVRGALVAGINDAAAVRRCIEAGEGEQARLSIGAGINKRFASPLEAEAEVVRLIKSGSPTAVVRSGEVEAILASGPASFSDRRQFESCGIDPLRYKIVVVKQGYLMPGLRPIAPRHIMLLTPGSSDMRIERLPYARRRKPAFPFEKETAFDPESAPLYEGAPA